MSSEKKQLIEELHKPARRRYKRRAVLMRGKDDTWEIDLVDMKAYSRVNKGNKYILTCIDTLSKYGFAEPCLTKSAKHVTHAFREILRKSGRCPKNIHSDRGLEFYNSEFQKLMKENNINHYSTFSVMKASICERFNRTLKEKMFKAFSLNGNYCWYGILQKLIKEYNDNYHRTIGYKPSEVDDKKAEELLKTVYSRIKIIPRPKFKVGQFVRISKYKTLFEKGYTPNWTTEIFKITKIRRSNPTTYTLQDSQGEEIAGSFYNEELQVVADPNLYLIEKVIKRRGKKAYVKYMGLAQNDWIDVSNIV